MLAAYRMKAKKVLAALAVLPFVISAGVWMVAVNSGETWVKNTPLLQRLALNDESLSSAETRLQMWPAVLRQIGASPFIGFGPETFAVTFPAYSPATVNTREDRGEIPDRAHNELLDFAVQIGIPGALAYAVFMLGIVAIAGKNFLERREEEWVTPGFASGILGLFTANIFGFSVTTHWVLLVLFVAVTFNTLFQKDFSTKNFRLHPFTKTAIFSVVAFCGIGMFWMQDFGKVMADAEMRRGYESATFAEFAQTAAAYKQATNLAPTEAFYALNYANSQLARLSEGERLSAAETMDAYGAAIHAARLRGYDGFSVSLAMEIKKWL
jgi:O-antigen ligase